MGRIVRSRVDEVRYTGRNTQGVTFANPGKNDAIVAVARNVERAAEEELEEAGALAPEGDDDAGMPGDGPSDTADTGAGDGAASTTEPSPGTSVAGESDETDVSDDATTAEDPQEDDQ